MTRSAPAHLKMFASVMDLPREEARVLIAEHTDYVGKVDYIDERCTVERWLREEAERARVSIIHGTPLYFRLTQEAYDRAPDEENNRRLISIPVPQIDLNSCSFTFEDSFCNYRHFETNGHDAFGVSHPLHGKVFNAEEVERHVMTHGFLFDLQAERPRYIEVQMWARPDFGIH